MQQDDERKEKVKYALFAGEMHHCRGGWGDIQCVSEDLDLLKNHCEELDIDDGWAHIVNLNEWLQVSNARKDCIKRPPSWEWEDIYEGE